MFGKAMFAALAVLACACAKPNYQDAPVPPPRSRFQKIKRACALKFASENLCADYLWEEPATESATGSIFLGFWDPADSSGGWVSPKATPGLVLWMPSMGHGSAPVKLAPFEETPGQQAAGVYRLTNVYFTMHGDWELRFQLKKGADVVDQVVVPFQF